MYRFTQRISPFWSKFGTPHSLQRTLTTSCLTCTNSSLYSRKVDPHQRLFHANNRLFILSRKHQHTESQDGRHDNDNDERPVPHFKNVLQHLQQLSSIFATSSAENSEFLSMLDQLASTDIFSDRLNVALKQKMKAQPEFLLEQSTTRIKQNILQHRPSLAVYSNGALLYPNLPPQKLSPGFVTEYISAMILSVLNYRSKLSKESPELHQQMFNSCRAPGAQIDIQNFSNTKSSEFSLVISRQSNFFLLELNEKMAEGEIFFVLKKVIEFILNYKNQGTIPFGSLSTLPRTDATFGFQFLNETGLKRLQEAQFLINLDHVDQEEDSDQLAKQILAGNRESIGNRWFDKAIQLILVLSAEADQIAASGICFEKSLVKTESVVDLMEHGIEFMTKFKPVEVQPESSTEDNKLMIKLQKLDLVQPGKRDVITSATNEFALKKYSQLINSFHLTRFNFHEYGNEFIENINCDSDAWIQVALGLAYRNYCQLSKSSTLPYKGVTLEVLDFFEDCSEEKLRLALESLQFYQQLTANGYDIENILRVYEQLIREEEGLPGKAIDIYKSLLRHPVLKQVNYPLITSKRSIPESTIYSGLVEVNGPPIPGGFACCYQFYKNGTIEFTIGHQQESSSQEVLREFTEFLNHALVQMKSIILQ